MYMLKSRDVIQRFMNTNIEKRANALVIFITAEKKILKTHKLKEERFISVYSLRRFQSIVGWLQGRVVCQKGL